MYDGLKLYNPGVEATHLLNNPRLHFTTRVGIDHATQPTDNCELTAKDRGLTFTLTPRRSETGHDRPDHAGPGRYSVRIEGSIHQFYNAYRGRADLRHTDDFTALDLLTALTAFSAEYGIDLTSTPVNNLEFGVNVQLPFRVGQLLNSLVSYRGRTFSADLKDGVPYYQCTFDRYRLKLYDKGRQYDLPDNLLRVEIKARKMAYFDDLRKAGHPINVTTLADLLTVDNYPELGTVLVRAFSAITFTGLLHPNDVPTHQQRAYTKMLRDKATPPPPDATPQQANAYRQRMSRANRQEQRLTEQYGRVDWPVQVQALIRQKWAQLTTVDADLLTRIDRARADGFYCDSTVSNTHSPAATCHKLTAPPNEAQTGQLSQIHTLGLVLNCDTPPAPIPTPDTPPNRCRTTGRTIPTTTNGRPRRFVSARDLATDDDLLMQVLDGSRTYAKGSKEDQYTRAAHNLRNRESNERHSLKRRIERYTRRKGGQQSLFPEYDFFPLTADQRAALDYWKGTNRELRL